MTSIEERLQALEQRVVQLELSLGLRWYQPGPLAPEMASPPARCSGCGITLDGTMGYVCSHARCPMGLGGVWSSAD